LARIVLDASVVLVVILEEPGARVVVEALRYITGLDVRCIR